MKPVTSTIPQAEQRSFYLRHVLGMGIGGALFTFLALATSQLIGEWGFGARLWYGEDPFWFSILLLIVFTLPVLLIYVGIAMRVIKTDFGFLFWRWMSGMFVLWIIGLILGSVPFFVFLLYWAAFAWLVTPKDVMAHVPQSARAKARNTAKQRLEQHGGTHQPAPEYVFTAPVAAPAPAKPASRAKKPNRGSRQGSYWRIPLETEEFLRKLVAQIQDLAAEEIATDLPRPLRRDTVRILLDGVLKTWWDGDLAKPLPVVELDLLRQSVRLSLDVAGNDLRTEGQAVYRGVLKGLVAGWGMNRL